MEKIRLARFYLGVDGADDAGGGVESAPAVGAGGLAVGTADVVDGPPEGSVTLEAAAPGGVPGARLRRGAGSARTFWPVPAGVGASDLTGSDLGASDLVVSGLAASAAGFPSFDGSPGSPAPSLAGSPCFDDSLEGASMAGLPLRRLNRCLADLRLFASRSLSAGAPASPSAGFAVSPDGRANRLALRALWLGSLPSASGFAACGSSVPS